MNMEFQINGINIYAFADTHGMHRKLVIPQKTDLLICAGDAVEDDLDPNAYTDFLDWFDKQPGSQKIFVPGNHELSFEIAPKLAELIFDDRDIILGCNTGLIYGGLSFYMMSSPIIPPWYEDIAQNADIIISHYPAEMIQGHETLNPDYFIHGHIHGCGGEQKLIYSTLHCNCSKYDELIKL